VLAGLKPSDGFAEAGFFAGSFVGVDDVMTSGSIKGAFGFVDGCLGSFDVGAG